MPELIGWSLRRRLAIAIAAFGIVLVTVVALSVVMLTALHSQQQEVVNRYFRAVTLTNARFIDQLDAETAVRGYALTSDSVTLEPINAFQSAGYRNDLNQLTALVGSDPATLSAFRTWDQAAQTWYTTWAEPTIAVVHAHGLGLPTATVLHGKQLFDDVRARYGAFSTQLVAKRTAADRRLKELTTLLFAAVLFAVVSVLLAAAALWIALRRWVLTPLAELGTQTRLVRDGQLQHELSVAGPRELTSVAGDVDDMRRALVDQLAEVERARVELEAAGAALSERATELSRSNRDLEQFAYVASHDLQEPLRKVASFCQLLEQRYKGELDERADQYIAFAVDGAKRMQQLINDLLAFSRVGRASTAFVDVDLGVCLDNAIGNLAAAIESSGAEIMRGPLPTLPGDAGLLTQLFQNLIGNSLKFRGHTTPLIEITAAKEGDNWSFRCADNGIGIDPQYADRIFVIFQRLHGKDEYDGTGIGLALCKRIIEHLGGAIWLDVDRSEGAAFHWTLPVVTRPPTLTLNPPQQEVVS
jgi:signal transduction histidine kinase